MSDDIPEDGFVLDAQVIVRDGDLEVDVEENIGEERTLSDMDPALLDLIDPANTHGYAVETDLDDIDLEDHR